MINPIPIAPTLEDETDLTVAVNLSGKPWKETVANPVPKPPQNNTNHTRNNYQMRIAQFIDDLKLRFDRQPEGALGVLDIIIKSMNIMENALTEAQLITYSPDIVIEIPRDVCNFYEFHRAREMIEVGQEKTRAVLAHYAKHITQTG